MIVLVTGGSSSGKSKFAEQCLMDLGKGPRVYMATMVPWDQECIERIERHRKMRREKGFRTVERPVGMSGEGVEKGSAVLLECMSNLLANELYRADMAGPEASAAERILSGLQDLRGKAGTLVVVTNEVFSDGGRYSAETERYLELLGGLNRKIAAAADLVYEVVCGIPLLLKAPGNGGMPQNQADKGEYI